MLILLQKNKQIILAFLLIVGLYLILRLPNLTLQPIFADEAIYIRWAQVMKAEPTLRFLPLSDGKTPLFMWAMIPLFKLFEDPLLAGRFLSVLSGFLTLLGVLFLGWKFFNPLSGFLAAFLITITPFMVFFDRMALVDSMLAAFSIWSLNLALLLIKYQRIDLAMFLGYLLGGCLLVKPSGIFAIFTVPITFLSLRWPIIGFPKKILKIFGLWLVSGAIAMIIYNVLRLGPGFSSINSRNQDYIFSPAELQGRMLDPFIPHFYDLVDWVPKLLTFPTLLFVVLGVILVLARRDRTAFIVLLWSLTPLLVQMVFLRTFTARYILFSIPPLIFLAGWALSCFLRLKKLHPVFSVGVVLAVFLPFSLDFNIRLITNPQTAPLPYGERQGYLEEWTAGYGLKDIAQFLISESGKGLVVVGTEGSFGTLPDGLQIYLDKHSHTAPKENQVVVIGGKAQVSSQLKEAALSHPTYFVANKSRFPKFNADLELIKEFPKAERFDKSSDAILFFRVLPASSSSGKTY